MEIASGSVIAPSGRERCRMRGWLNATWPYAQLVARRLVDGSPQ
jgi:hypothetical protein